MKRVTKKNRTSKSDNKTIDQIKFSTQEKEKISIEDEKFIIKQKLILFLT